MSIFSKVSMKRPKSSTFNLSHEKKLTCNMGDLIPVLVQECVPGDKFEVSTSQILRMMPMIAPAMHEVNVFTHFFFVPNRILWDKWEDFITGGESGLDATLAPKLSGISNPTDAGIFTAPGTLWDYIGLPQVPTGSPLPDGSVSALPFAAYQKIYNEYYRDQNLITPVVDTVVAGNNSFGDLVSMRKRAWQHDYFTSALPFAQKGNPVKIPLGTDAPIVFNDTGTTQVSVLPGTSTGNLSRDVTGTLKVGTDFARIDNSDQLSVDLSNATSYAINDLRKAFKLQEWLEKNARGGSRYTESILSHFGVRSKDARLQRPEYLGGGMSPVMISEVLQTSEGTTSSPQANMAGHGLNVGNSGKWSKFCEEHGFIIGIMSVMPKTAYYQGIPRQFTKFDKFDYFWPEFEHIGEQEIKNKEVYFQSNPSNDDATFGYIPRYSEYKFNPSTVHGYFKSSLKFWTLVRDFSTAPALNKAFVEANPSRRIFAVDDPDEHTILVQMYHNIKARRLMSYYSDPSFR